MVGPTFWRIPMAVWTVHTSTRTAWIQLVLHGRIHRSFTVSLRFTWVQTLTGLGGIGRYVDSTDLLMRVFMLPEHYYSFFVFSAPVLSRGTTTSALSTPDDISSRSSWKAYSNGEFSPKLDLEDSSSFGVATPLFKSFMTQVFLFL